VSHDQAREAIEAFVESIEAVAFVVGLDNPTRWVSESWAHLYGGDPSRLVTDSTIVLGDAHPDDLDRMAELRLEIHQRARAATAPHAASEPRRPPLRAELRLRTVDGSFRWTDVRCDVVVTSDGSRFLAGMIADDSRLHDARAALDAMAMAEAEAERTSAEFVSKMSHELRTPLHAILGYAQLLEMGAGDASEYLSRLRRAGDHLVQVLDDLLDYSRLDAGRLAVRDEIVGVDDVVDAAVDMTSALAAVHHVEIVRAVHSPEHVRADATRLRQVVANLMSNAIKYNHPGGTVTVTTGLDNGRVVIEVADTGTGVAPDVLSRLLVPFDRMGAEGSGVAGAGLGLPVANGLVHAMGGALEFSSEVGVGSRARVVFDAVEPPVPDVAVRSIVCIDDDPESRRILDAVLSHLPGSEVRLASSGAAGLEILALTDPGLIVLDRHLPDYDPDTLLRAVTAAAPSCPVVIVSSDPQILEPSFCRPPVVATFAKPLDLDAFIDAVTRRWSIGPT
jgi:signal transduction histidine kinase